ncbi:MAG TPA: 3-hydroxyacyl-CoA dehydrogenase NAD-binding domain-containing protein, partial [Brevundimonas sp.]|nr:3-hydroxyacyl-CoA dehydrogenase NAD-binding domain-containing protein [Brevundimonas sp.]
MTTIKTVAIIGAGQMGAGIAQTVAAGGYDVKLYDAAGDRVPQAMGAIAASLARQV